MAGFQKRSWGAKKSASATPQDNKKDEKWDVNVKLAKRSEKDGVEWYRFKLGSFKFEDIDTMNRVNPDLFKIKQSAKNNALLIYVRGDKIEEFMGSLDQFVDALRATNHYSEQSLQEFPEKMEKYYNTVPSQAELDANQQTIASNWKELIKTMADPEVQKRFLAFQTTHYCTHDLQLKDAALSPQNVIEVLMADPQASFVTDIGCWNRDFNRTVQPNSPHVIITKVQYYIPSANEMDKDPLVQQAGGWNTVVRDSGGVSYGAAWAAIKRYNKKYPHKQTYYKAKVYDVRFTTPKDPNNDPFMQIANVVNNLTGELNDVAKQILTQAAIEKGEEQPQFDKKTQGLENDAALEKYKEFLIKKCKSEKVAVYENGDVKDVIANAIFNYANEKAEKYNILAPKAKNLFASVVCYAVASTFNIDSARVSSCVQAFKGLKDSEADNIVSASYEIYKELTNYRIHEAIGDGHIMSFSEFEDLIFSQVPTAQDDMESVKNEFNEMLQRMNSLLR